MLKASTDCPGSIGARIPETTGAQVLRPSLGGALRSYWAGVQHLANSREPLRADGGLEGSGLTSALDSRRN